MTSSMHGADYKRFRELLTAARERVGLTQMEVARRLSRPQSFVSKYETGERRLDVVEFVAVCEALNVKPDRILAALRGQ